MTHASHLVRGAAGLIAAAACAAALCIALPATAQADEAGWVSDDTAAVASVDAAPIDAAATDEQQLIGDADDSSASIVYAGANDSDDDGYTAWRYRLSDGTYASGWQFIGGSWYYFDPLNDDVACVGGVYLIGDDYYGFDENAHMSTGWFEWTDSADEVHWSYASGSGGFVTGWKQLGGSWYYFLANTAGHPAATGCYQLGDMQYWFDSDGRMETGWIYFTRTSTGEGDWSYATPTGSLAQGWWQLGGSWFYFLPDEDGNPAVTGIVRLGTMWYSFDNGGRMQTGWIRWNGTSGASHWSYATSGGSFLSGWQLLGGSYYYFQPEVSGMPAATGRLTLGSNHYTFDSDGRWTGYF